MSKFPVFHILFMLVGVIVVTILHNPWAWALYLLLALGGLWWIARTHASHYLLQCPGCAEPFRMSIWQDLTNPRIVDEQGVYKYVYCPDCHQQIKARLIPA